MNISLPPRKRREHYESYGAGAGVARDLPPHKRFRFREHEPAMPRGLEQAGAEVTRSRISTSSNERSIMNLKRREREA
ncbi:hypothetical protein T492DRAFT_1003314 [Pavlovales sp. CCMP2436]|nr:hypothetical protein T492DRAFT_1003314 [Pavlovales sp. CCMP2436]